MLIQDGVLDSLRTREVHHTRPSLGLEWDGPNLPTMEMELGDGIEWGTGKHGLQQHGLDGVACALVMNAETH